MADRKSNTAEALEFPMRPLAGPDMPMTKTAIAIAKLIFDAWPVRPGLARLQE